MQAYAASSGFCLGGANWIIKTHSEKVESTFAIAYFPQIVYLADSSLQATRHPEKLNMEELKNPDVLIATKLSNEPNAPLWSTNDFFSAVGEKSTLIWLNSFSSYCCQWRKRSCS